MDFGFIIKKLSHSFVEPLGLILTLFAFGIYFLFVGKNKLAKISLSTSFGLLLLFSYPPFSNMLIKNLEQKYEKYSYDNNVSYIHVLGGGHNTDKTQPISSLLSDASTKRVLEGVIIYKNTPGSKLIFTGYEGKTDISTAQMNANLAITLGVPKEDMIINANPKDTYEEAEFCKTVVKNSKFVLVTSASHMPRSIMLFKRKGLKPIAAPTYFQKSNIVSHIPTIDSLYNSKMAIHEYIGIIWAKM